MNEHLDEYYKTCPFPKSMGEPRSKKKKLYNGYKAKPSRRCWYTGKMGAERHEVFPGIYRQTSIEMGFQVDVCSEIHRELQANSSEWAKTENKKWKMYYQALYEEKLIETGIKEEQARELWIALMGQNYLP